MITADDLQVSLKSISHNAGDCREALETGDEDIVDAGLCDIIAIVEELYDCLPRRPINEDAGQCIDDIADSVDDL